MRVTRSDIIAPANFISLAGLAFTVAGSCYLHHWSGIAMASLGRVLDLIDGPVARRTHVSQLGAKIDAVFDKLCILALLIAILAYELAPAAIVLYILLQNVVVAYLGIAASRRGIHMQSSRAGKNNVFLQSCSLLLFAAGAQVRDYSSLFSVAATGLLAVSLYYAVTAVAGYIKVAKTGNP